MIDLMKVGAYPKQVAENQWNVHFGIYLPEIRPAEGYQLKVHIIHEQDQFVREIEPQEHNLT